MNINATERRRSFCAVSFFRRGFVLLALAFSTSLNAQLTTVLQTYNVPRVADGSAFSVFFDLSSQLSLTTASITRTTLSLDFAKQADLSDDPPFYSEMGFVLRKLDTHFSILKEVTLIELGSFNDGEPFTLFDGVLTFDDSAARVVNYDPDYLGAGSFRGEESLDLLNGAYSPYWELRVVDAAFQNPLLFRSATLSVTASIPSVVPVNNPVPESSTIGLTAAGLLLGVIGLRSRRRRTS